MTRFGDSVCGIRYSSTNFWPMSFAGIFLGMLTAQAVERFEAKIIVPPNVSLTVTNTSLPAPLLLIVPTNMPVNVVRLPSIAHGCDVPITYVTSSSIDNPGGPNLTVTENKVFRRRK